MSIADREAVESGETVNPNVTNLLPLIPAAEVSAHPLPPHALAAPLPEVDTPEARVSPIESLIPVATLVAVNPCVPKLVWPFTSQSAKTFAVTVADTTTLAEEAALLMLLVSVATA